MADKTRERVFMFIEESGDPDDPHVFESPQAWADWVTRERGVPNDVVQEVLTAFSDPSRTEYVDAAARFVWRDVITIPSGSRYHPGA